MASYTLTDDVLLLLDGKCSSTISAKLTRLSSESNCTAIQL